MLPKSCREVQVQDHSAVDGDYWIQLPTGHAAKVYCSLETQITDYITLPSGDNINYGFLHHGVNHWSRTTFSKIGFKPEVCSICFNIYPATSLLFVLRKGVR